MAVLTSTERLSMLLDNCLNWQERCAAIVLDATAPNRRIRKLATELAATGIKKKTFLMDALESCLRDADCMPQRAPLHHHDLDVALRSDYSFFMARAFAKLFCALMSTRTLRWSSGGKFDYHTADRDTIFGPGQSPGGRSAASLLARGLKTHAVYLAQLVEALQDHDKYPAVFRAAVAGAPPADPSDRRVLLDLWRDGRERLPIDRLWTRISDCEFRKHCLEYDEFHYVSAEPSDYADAHHDAAKARAETKLTLLKAAAAPTGTPDQGTAQQWRALARNWLCRGFLRRIYLWDSEDALFETNPDRTGAVDAPQPAPQPRNSRGRVDLAAETATVIAYVADANSPAYAKARALHYRSVLSALGLAGHPAREYYPTVVRLATAGHSVDDIAEELDWQGGTEDLYALLFLVASERRGPRLQECWTNIAGTA